MRNVQKYIYPVIICPCLYCAISTASPAKSEIQPAALYLTWQNNPSTTMTVLWHSEHAPDSDNVNYRKIGEFTWKKASGKHQKTPALNRFVHVVELTELTPDSVYEWKIDGYTGTWRFQTMPATLEKGPLRFVVGSDVQVFDGGVVEEVSRQIARTSPRFIVIDGDLAACNGLEKRAARWIDFFDVWKRHMIDSNGNVIPLLPVIGNHEVKGHFSHRIEEAPYYYGVFPTVREPGYYAIDFGNYLTIVCLDSGHTHSVGGAQTKWLERTLRNRAKKNRLIFAVYHVPAYPALTNYKGDFHAVLREHWTPLFDQYHVAVAFEGHCHRYKRSYRLKQEKKNPAGTLYIGGGGWGISPRRPKKNQNAKKWYLKRSEAKNHFIQATLTTDAYTLDVIDENGNVFDSVRSMIKQECNP